MADTESPAAREFIKNAKLKIGKSEAAITAEITQHLKAMGATCWHFKVHGAQFSRAGVPDICAVIAGVPVFLEVKRVGGVATALQLKAIEQIRMAGGVAAVVTSAAQVRELLAEKEIIKNREVDYEE